MMWFYVYCVALLIFTTRCSCSLRKEVEKLSETAGRSEDMKCFETVINVTNWESHKFLLISEDFDEIDARFSERIEVYGWQLQSVAKIGIKEFINVIIFTKNFDSLGEILETVDTKSINTRIKFVISVKERFASLDEIRNASKGIPEAMWKLDKTRVIFLVPSKEIIFAMTYFPFADNCRPGKLEVVNIWRDGSFAKEIDDFFSEKMLDIRGCVKNYSAILYPSMRIQGFKEYNEQGVAVLGGVGGKLVGIIAEKMNMKLHLLPEQPKSWWLLVDQIKYDESIFSVLGNIPLAHYLEVLDQDIGYMEESFGFGYLTGGLDVSWKNFVWPMTTEMWAWTGCTFLFSCSVVLAANLVHRRSGSRSDQLSFLDFFGIFLGNSRGLPANDFGRYLFGIWIFYSYLITSAYNSGLVSFLTTPNEKRVMNSFGDMIDAGMDFGGGQFHRDFYNDPTDPIMMEIYNNFKIWSDDESMQLLMSGEGATGVVTSMCSQYNREQRGKGDNRLRMLEDKAFTFHVPITMRRGSPFTIGVHRYAWRATQSGLVQYWLNYYSDIQTSKKIRTKSPTVITVRHLRGILYLHIVGLISSCFVFIGELIFRKHFPNHCTRHGRYDSRNVLPLCLGVDVQLPNFYR